MLTYNLYTNMSSVNWNPLDFNIIGDQFVLDKEQLYFTNGINFNRYSFFDNIKDYSFNNKTGIFLTDYKNNEFLNDKYQPLIQTSLSSIKSILSDYNGNIYKKYTITPQSSGLNAQDDTYDINDVLTFNFYGDKVYVEDFLGFVLTNGGTGDGQLYFAQKNDPISENQLWDYLLGDGAIILFSNNTKFSEIVLKNQFFNLEVSEFTLTAEQLPNNSYLFLNSYKKSKVSFNSVSDSFLVKYDPSPILNQNSLIINKISSYQQNYLGVFPFKNIDENGKCDFYFHSLKNYQSYDYEYGVTGVNREYNKIYTGSNQEKGLNKIYLNYNTDHITVDLHPNRETEFYFNATTDIIPLSAARFIESGATSGDYPYVSDKIFTNSNSVFDEISDVYEIIPKTNTKNLKFLCSWLYEDSNTGKKSWYDRYYNSAYFTLDQALSAAYYSYNKFMVNNNSVVFDIASNVILTPGVKYRYYHIGNDDYLNNLDILNYKIKDNNLVYTNILNITSWYQNPVDSTPYSNDGLTFGNSGGYFGNFWNLDGSNYAVFQANDNLLETDNITVSISLSVDDWSRLNGYQIFGNYFNSGFGLMNDANTTAPIITIFNNNNRKIHNFNYTFGQTSNIKTNMLSANYVQRLSDLSYWVFDTVNVIACKFNVDDGLAVQPFIIKGLTQIDQVETDEDENLYVYDNDLKIYIKLNSITGAIIGSGSINSYCNRIEIGTNNVIFDGLNGSIGVFGNCSVIDNDNNLWQVIGPNLYKNKDIVATVGNSNQLSCDIYNNIWILSDNDAYTKVDSNGNLIFRKNFSKSPLPPDNNCPILSLPEPPTLVLDEDLPFLSTDAKEYILTYDTYQQILVTPPKPKRKFPYKPIVTRSRVMNFVSVPFINQNNSTLTSICGLSATQFDKMVLVDLNDNQAYLIDQNGELSFKINLEVYSDLFGQSNFKTDGDFTGYQNIRKFKLKNKTTLSWKFQTSDDKSNILSKDVSQLSNGWHNFTFTFDGISGIARYYIDSILVDTLFLKNNLNVKYLYRTSLLLGETSIKNTTLNVLLNLQEGYRYIGGVADLKIYNIELSPNDVKQLYYSSVFSPRIKPVSWKMKTGVRNYVEEISKYFQFQLPTNKSNYYNINIHNLNISDELKKNIELAINNIVGKLSPAYTNLHKINWK